MPVHRNDIARVLSSAFNLGAEIGLAAYIPDGKGGEKGIAIRHKLGDHDATAKMTWLQMAEALDALAAAVRARAEAV